jgi:hypothetical protein
MKRIGGKNMRTQRRLEDYEQQGMEIPVSSKGI